MEGTTAATCEVEATDVVRVVLQFLKENGLTNAMLALQDESQVALNTVDNLDTFVHDVLGLCGARSVAFDAAARYPELSPEEAVSRGVELVLLASEPWEFDEAQRAEVAAARCFGDAEVRLVDGRDFCWHGARMADGLGRALDAVRS